MWLYLAKYVGVSYILLFRLNKKIFIDENWEIYHVHIYLHAPIQIIHNKLWYMYERTSLRVELNEANVY